MPLEIGDLLALLLELLVFLARTLGVFAHLFAKAVILAAETFDLTP